MDCRFHVVPSSTTVISWSLKSSFRFNPELLVRKQSTSSFCFKTVFVQYRYFQTKQNPKHIAYICEHNSHLLWHNYISPSLYYVLSKSLYLLSRHITFSLDYIPSTLVLYTSSINIYGSNVKKKKTFTVHFSSAVHSFSFTYPIRLKLPTRLYSEPTLLLSSNYILILSSYNVYHEVTYFEISRHKFCAQFCSPLHQ